MGAKKLGQQQTRVITQNSSGTYAITLPLQVARELHWRKGQKVTVTRRGNKLIVEDWKPN